jgi:hypothetical protein
MSRRVALIIGGALLLIAAGTWTLTHRQAPLPHDTIDGGDGGGLPRAQPLDERIDGAALQRAAQDPVAEALQALVVMRNGHLVFERYGAGFSAESMLDGGGFARALLALAAGVAANDGALPPTALQGFEPPALRAGIESGSQQPYALYLSQKVWSRLNAASAWIERPSAAAAAPADCCLHARVLDWMRLASLLADNGRFEGKQVIPAGWVQRMQRPLSADAVRGFGIELAAAAHGAEAFAAPQVFFLRGPQRWRLWLCAPLKLAVLFGAAAPAANWDETRLPNLVLRAVSDRPSEPGDATELQRLVPGH